MTDLVIRAAWVLPLDRPPIPDGEVLVRDGVVVEVGRGLVGDETHEHAGVLLPGLVNAHAHLVYGPSYADLATAGLPFHAWIAELLPRRRAMSAEQHVAEARASAAQMVATGTTAVADVVSVIDTVPVLAESGLGGRAYWELAGADTATWQKRRGAWLADLARHPDAGISPHTLYTLGDAVVRDLVDLARREGRRLHPHLAETAAEAEWVLAGTGPYRDLADRFGFAFELATGSGRTPVQHLDHLGGLGPDVHVAHGVHVDAADRKVLRDKGSAVALCVRSNATLGAGEPPVRAYREESSPVAIGTDSLASTPDLDLLAELRAVERLAVDQGSDRDGLHRWLVEAATLGGAAALGLPTTAIAPGARADLVVVEGDGSDPYEQVVHGRAVRTYLAGATE